MSNPSKDHTSIRVHAPPGGHSNNIFGTSEFEQSAANKKNNMSSDIFGAKEAHADPAPAKQTRNTGNNIFGSEPQQSATTAGTLAGQYKQTQMKSNIFGTDEPAASRTVSDKNRSNIFGIGDNDDPSKRQAGGVRRVGYNPINGEAYNPNPKSNGNEKQPETTVKTTEESNGTAQAADATVPPKNGATQAASETGNTQVAPAESKEASAATTNNDQKADNNQKNVHTSVRVFHPPGGRSNGPLW